MEYKKTNSMILSPEKYTCDCCDYSEWSDCGNPLKGFDRLTYTLMLCDSCLKQYTEEREEEERMALQEISEEEARENDEYIRDNW